MRRVFAAVVLAGTTLVACSLYIVDDSTRFEPDAGPSDGRHGRRDAGAVDAGPCCNQDASPSPCDAGAPDDGPLSSDGGLPFDGPRPSDGGLPFDGPRPSDGGPPVDGPRSSDAGVPGDGAPPDDGPLPSDGGLPFDGPPYIDGIRAAPDHHSRR
jgi:hypothetical protein